MHKLASAVMVFFAMFCTNASPAQPDVPVSAQTAAAIDRFSPYFGDYEGAMRVFTREGDERGAFPIRWTIEPAFFGREVRMEFIAMLGDDAVTAWLGLFGYDDLDDNYTTYWVNTRIRDAGYDLTDGELFAERGVFDEAGRTLTLLATHKTDLDGTMVEYRSTFHFADDGFRCVDEQYDAEAEQWWTVVEFTLTRTGAE